MELASEREQRLRAARRIVIKLGTSTVTGADSGVCIERVEPLVGSIVKLTREGRQVVLVSSGAVGLGAGRLGLERARLSGVVMRQACAAVGQSLLMQAYEGLFGKHDAKIAQMLLTEEDFTEWRRYVNLRRTTERLLKLDVVPIINENDTVSTTELEYLSTGSTAARVFSDNDRLAALVMSKLEADALVLLTDVDGLQLRNNSRVAASDIKNSESPVVELVTQVTPELRAAATGPSASGRGGMLTKLEAAEIALHAGGLAVIANGRKPGILEAIFAGEGVGTTFLSTKSPMRGKRRWIAYAANVRGRMIVNTGAHEAIVRGKASLLASGVVRVENHFAPHDVVSIADSDGREFARGIANCASEEAAELIAKLINTPPRSSSSSQEQAAAAAKTRVLVTRNNIVLLDAAKPVV